ncbi:MAG: radical SAM protein, partial [Clostridia bacterium]|nr:radical SAM protein [Clostridia bacterium]
YEHVSVTPASDKAVKNAFPDCYILFGGHSVSAEGFDLERYPFVDFLIHRFGEEPTADLLRAFVLRSGFDDVANISYRADDGRIITTRFEPQTATDFPSPYLTGVFDDILNDPVDFSVLFETNRGCPNSCSFCDWGSLKSKVRLFPIERVKAELDWFAERKIEFVYCTDGNFCLFDRDAEIADYVISRKEIYGYPKIFRVCFTKNRPDLVFGIGSALVKHGLDKAQTISFQSMNPTVLQNIGRKNIPTERFRGLMKRYNELKITTFSELILGLPGETYDSFCSGVGELLENGQHFALNIYPCELLPNAEMGQPWYKEKFGIKSVRVPFQLIHSYAGQKKDDITEYSEYVVATDSMDSEQWARSMIFANYVMGLHNLGLTRAVAIWYRNELGVPYDKFYKDLISASGNASFPLLNRIRTRISKLCFGVAGTENSLVATCEGLSDLLWGFDELIFLEFYNNIDVFYDELRSLLALQYPESEETDALFSYQRDIIKKINVKTVSIRSEYDFYGYFQRIFMDEYSPLEKRPTVLSFDDPKPAPDFPTFARKVVWYGRNRRETDYSSSHYPVNVSYV